MNKNKALIFDTHPTSYRSNLYKNLGEDLKNNLLICYLSGYSLRSHVDIDFNSIINDTGVSTENYIFKILSKIKKPRKVGFSIFYFVKAIKIIGSFKPKIIIFTSLAYPIFAFLAFFIFLTNRDIKLGLRTETEDLSRKRSLFKSFLRNIIYHIIYYPIKIFMPIGYRSKKHFLKYKNNQKHIIEVPYVSAPTISNINSEAIKKIRSQKRKELKIRKNTKIITFAGKLINKKNVDYIINSLTYSFPETLNPSNIHLLIIGEGVEKKYLKNLCKIMKKKKGINYSFTGFVEPDKLNTFYLASDIFVLPSRQSGETWGIVCNEALECGCSLIISEYAGCSCDFSSLERVEVIDINSYNSFSEALIKLYNYKWDYKWCKEVISGKYSLQSVSKKLSNYIKKL